MHQPFSAFSITARLDITQSLRRSRTSGEGKNLRSFLLLLFARYRNRWGSVPHPRNKSLPKYAEFYIFHVWIAPLSVFSSEAVLMTISAVFLRALVLKPVISFIWCSREPTPTIGSQWVLSALAFVKSEFATRAEHSVSCMSQPSLKRSMFFTAFRRRRNRYAGRTWNWLKAATKNWSRSYADER